MNGRTLGHRLTNKEKFAMARLFPVLVLTASLLLAGCGQVFVGIVSNPQIPSSIVSGIVIVVHLESAMIATVSQSH
jgi:hypothetical protein